MPLMPIDKRGVRRFEAELVEGHKGVVVAIVPFDPEEAFGPPVRLAGRRHGWVVSASLNGTKFDGYIGERWGRFFVIVDKDIREAAGVAAGDRVSIGVAPSDDPGMLERAIEQSHQTTQPSKARAYTTATRPKRRTRARRASEPRVCAKRKSPPRRR
jgi:hypothetical protein